ncbi:Coagulation factor XI, partial [Orchesella cincta]
NIIHYLVILVIFICRSYGQTNFAGIPCGKQFDRVPKIVGGIPTFQNEFPWVVSLKRHGKHFCSGVIVHSRFVLTAAQCVTFKKSIKLSTLSVTTGEYFLNLPEEPNDATNYSVENILIHPNYDKTTHEFDIAMIRLKKSAFISPATWPACLTSYRTRYDGKTGIVVGWGVTDVKNSSKPSIPKLSEVLRKVSVPIWRNKECQDAFNKAKFNFTVHESQMCAGSYGKDTCDGDSGSPLMSKMSYDKKMEVIGITIGGRGCGVLPGVYTKVKTFLPWIEACIAAFESP